MAFRPMLFRAVSPFAVVLACAAGGAFADAPAPITSDQFLPGWQDQTRPLFWRGPSHRDPSRDVWTLDNAPRPGRYVLVQRQGNLAQLLPGHQFRVGSDPFEKVHVLLPSGSGEVEAMPVEYLPKALRDTLATDITR